MSRHDPNQGLTQEQRVARARLAKAVQVRKAHARRLEAQIRAHNEARQAAEAAERAWQEARGR